MTDAWVAQRKSEWRVMLVMAGNDVIYNGDVDLSLYIPVTGDLANDPQFGPVFWDDYSAQEWIDQYG